MRYFSTNKISPKVDFREAAIKGLAPDKGLYFPETIPRFTKEFIDNISDFSNVAIGLEMIKPYVGDSIPSIELQSIVEDTLNFEIPLVMLDERTFSLELFHGPTLAFKDVGARFMSRCLGHFAKTIKQKIYVLVATSGDTGSAVANGFYKVEGVEVVLLYPSGKVSPVQERQLTTLGENIHALEVNGNFDDCQRMVKEIFANEELNNKLFLTSANSINVARWLPQQFYYGIAWKNWPWKKNPPVFSVPSGNFGNICAGLLAAKSGMPVKKFIAGLNANDVVLKYLQTGNYTPGKTVSTISNAMDVGNPSNFIRLQEIFEHSYDEIINMVEAYAVSDVDTRMAMKIAFSKYDYLTDPHGAVAFHALQKHFEKDKESCGIFLETAHPVKFIDVVKNTLDTNIDLPASIAAIMDKPKKARQVEASTKQLEEFLLSL